MRPLSLAERLREPGAVSLKDLLSGEKRALDGSTEMSAVQYTDEIVRS